MRRAVLILALLGCDDDPSDAGSLAAGDAAARDTAAMDAAASVDADPEPHPGADAAAGPDAQPDTGPEPDAAPRPSLDELLAEVLAAQPQPITALDPPPEIEPALYALGRLLFFDPILSGNLDTACASCHHPAHGLSDGLPLAVGTGATGVGPARGAAGHPAYVPRHTPDLSNRGDPSWRRMYWDGRVERVEDGSLRAPTALPEALSGVLAAQALFPMYAADEMRGLPGDARRDGEPNELAALPADDPLAIWQGIVDRLLGVPEYVELFAAAYPDLDRPPGIAEVANALAAFQTQAFAFTDTPWDRYLRGETDALNDATKLGALVFFGGAACGACHQGPLLTDQRFHNIGVPQLGPGVGAAAPYDHGREAVSGDPAERFAFRTAPLRNVALSPPYMHNGALPDLGAIFTHYASPPESAAGFDPEVLPDDLRATLRQDAAHLEALVGGLSADLEQGADGRTSVGLSNVRQFLLALTDPAAEDLSHLAPERVPSGLTLP